MSPRQGLGRELVDPKVAASAALQTFDLRRKPAALALGAILSKSLFSLLLMKSLSPLGIAIAISAISTIAPAYSQSMKKLSPSEADLAESHCAALKDGAGPGPAFVYAMQTNAIKLDDAIARQQATVQRARNQLSAVDPGSYGYSGYGGTRAVIEQQIARAASGATSGLTVQEATRNYWNAKEDLMLLNQRAARWSLAMKQELQRLQSGVPISQVPELYDVNLVQTCPELLK
jgi:hypothetical protein